jgi:predicted Zn-dependent protease
MSDVKQVNCRRLFTVVLVAAAVGCAPSDGAGPGHRAQRLALSPQQEYELGQQAFDEILRQARQKQALITSGRDVQQVRTVGQAIAGVATGSSRMSQLLRREINLQIEGYRFDWEFVVIQSKQVNAFCLPGGKVVVFTGLLRLVDAEGRGRDDWLATVLAHEIAHALAHHTSERLAREQLTEWAGKVIGGVGQLANLPFERSQESEADHVGVFLMTFAGYDPRAAVAFWEAMARRGGGAPPEVLSDHPSDARRVAQLRQWSEQALAAKQAYDKGQTVDRSR